MNARGEEVGLDEKLVGRGLHPILATDTPHFSSELLLRLPSTQMFDHAIGEYNVEPAILERQIGSISNHGRTVGPASPRSPRMDVSTHMSGSFDLRSVVE